MDARALLAVLLTLTVLGSESLERLLPYAVYGLLILLAALHWKAPILPAFLRAMKLSPVLLLLAAGLPVSRLLDQWLVNGSGPGMGYPVLSGNDITLAGSLFLRALLAVMMLTLLLQAIGWDGILRGLRLLGLPLAVTVVLSQLERYRQLIAAEWRRTSLAREARSPGGQRFTLTSYSGQAGMVFLRSWERSERVHAAMLARGYALDGDIRLGPAEHPSWSARWLPHPLWLPAFALLVRLAL